MSQCVLFGEPEAKAEEPKIIYIEKERISYKPKKRPECYHETPDKNGNYFHNRLWARLEKLPDETRRSVCQCILCNTDADREECIAILNYWKRAELVEKLSFAEFMGY